MKKRILFFVIFTLLLCPCMINAADSVKVLGKCQYNGQSKNYECSIDDKSYSNLPTCQNSCYTSISKTVTSTSKNFCETGQKYYFDDCQEVEKQCSYVKASDYDSKAYVNISVMGLAKAGEGNGTGSEIKNWGQSSEGVSDAKSTYLTTKKCPSVLIEYWGYYVTSYDAYSTVYSKLNNPSTVYYLKSETTNSNARQTTPSNSGENSNDEQTYPNVDSCAGFKSSDTCQVGMTASGTKFGCVWNAEYEFCSPSGLVYLACGDTDSEEYVASTGEVQKYETNAYDIPVIAPKLTSYAIVALKTITPVVLIFIAMFQLIKAIMSQKEDEMKKAKSSLIKKLIAAVIIFFMVSIVQFIIKIVADDAEQSSTTACLTCFINNDCGKSYYYTDGYGNCYSVETNDQTPCPVDDY